MKAIVYTKYGPPEVLHLQEVKKPAVNEEQVLVKVHAASINAGDWHFLTADPFPMRLIGTGLFRPKNTILGTDIAGRVEALAETSNGFVQGMRCLEIFLGLAAAVLPNMFLSLKAHWR
jgi:NADPH:quinone reductase-like Zn-dependent oxidoreductase